MSKRFKPLASPLLPLLAMDRLWPGVGDSSAVEDQVKTVLQIQASDSAFAAFWVMDPLLPGVILTTVATVEPCRVGSSMCSRSAGWGAFAAILDDRSVVTCGHAAFGADSSAVQSQLKNVQQIQASQRAFAAILSDGSVVTWGHAGFGGDSSAVQGQLKHVQQIQASLRAFAAILGDGSVVTWGAADHGGDSSAVQAKYRSIDPCLMEWSLSGGAGRL